MTNSGLSLLLRHRHLIWAMAKREIFERYAGQMLGAAWAFAHPLILMGVYLFIFGYVFRVRIGGTADLPLDYPTYLLAGIVPWLTLAESLNKAPTAITNNASLVKQVVFPLEVLPAKTVLASMLAQTTGLVVLVAYVLISYGSLPRTYLLLPLVILMQFMLTVGLAFLLSAIGVFIRDLKDIVQVLTLIGVYLLPVLYLPAMVPELFRPLLYVNPFTYLIWCYHDVCYFGRLEHPVAWLVMVPLSRPDVRRRVAHIPSSSTVVRQRVVIGSKRRGVERTVLHLGNILNNGYLNAKVLRRHGWNAVAVGVDYWHVQGQPEWDEVEIIDPKLSHFDPDWSTIDVKGFERPWWFHDPLLAQIPAAAINIENRQPGNYRNSQSEPASKPQAAPPQWKSGLRDILTRFGVLRAKRVARTAMMKHSQEVDWRRLVDEFARYIPTAKRSSPPRTWPTIPLGQWRIARCLRCFRSCRRQGSTRTTCCSQILINRWFATSMGRCATFLTRTVPGAGSTRSPSSGHSTSS